LPGGGGDPGEQLAIGHTPRLEHATHFGDGQRCEPTSGQARRSQPAVAGPPSRARTKHGRMSAAARRGGASISNFCVARR
jgi:hypothetical protein